MKSVLEIACFRPEALKIAQDAGASRIEFCSNYTEGGITPAQKDILWARENLLIPLHVIIRPRAGDFVYTSEELLIMSQQINFCKSIQVDGLVFGVLDHNKRVDIKSCEKLRQEAYPMQICFHRAIDQCLEPEREIEKLIQVGFTHVLSSGSAKTAMEGKNNLRIWQEKYGNKIKIMPGGSVRSDDLEELAKYSKCTEFHSSAISGKDELCDVKEIKRMKNILTSLSK